MAQSEISPLHEACMSVDTEKVKSLISDSKMDVNAPDITGCTPLHIIFSRVSPGPDKTQIINCLLDAGADFNHRDPYKMLPIQYGLMKTDIDAIQCLFQHGLNVNAKDEKDNTLLHLACEYHVLEIVQYLVENGANVNAQNSVGSTPLHVLCAWMPWATSKLDILKCLLKGGLNVNLKDMMGQTPMEVAMRIAEYDNLFDVIQCIIECGGADIDSNIFRPYPMDSTSVYKTGFVTKIQNSASVI